MKAGLSADYLSYISSEAWEDKKREFRNSVLYHSRCESCGATGVRLDIHHKTYAHFGHEWLVDLAALCRPCHERVHEGPKRIMAAKREQKLTRREQRVSKKVVKQQRKAERRRLKRLKRRLRELDLLPKGGVSVWQINKAIREFNADKPFGQKHDLKLLPTNSVATFGH